MNRLPLPAAAAFLLLVAAACAPPPPTVLPDYTGRVAGGTLVIAPFHAESELGVPRLPGEERADAERRYARFFRHALAREIQRQTRFDRVVVDEFAGAPSLEVQAFNQRPYTDQRLRTQAGHVIAVAAPKDGQAIPMQHGTPDFVLLFGDADIEAVRGELLPGTIEMPHRLQFVLWNNRTGEPALFSQTRRPVTIYVEPLPAGTPLDEQMARARYLDGLPQLVDAMFGGTPFHVASGGVAAR